MGPRGWKMSAVTKHRPPLLVSVWVELGKGHVSEDYLIDCDRPACFLDGHTSGQHITINPIPATVETVLHELLHRLHPAWQENYVRNRTTYLLRRMTDEEVQQFYKEYQRTVKRPKRAKRVEDE